MRDHHAVVPQCAGHNRGSHARTAGGGSLAHFVDFRVGRLDQARHQDGMGFTARSNAEACDESFDSGLGGDFAEFLTAHAVGHDEEPAVGAALRLARRQHVAHEVFIVVADAANVS